MTKIIINEKAICNGNGHHIDKHCKAVFNIPNGNIYTSGLDAARELGITTSTVSDICNRRAKRRKDLIFVSKAHEHIDEIAQAIKAKDKEIADLKAQLGKYQHLIERESKAKELERLKEIRIAKENAFEKAKAKLSKEYDSLMEMDSHIAELEHFVGR